jgi:ribosomal protein S18 acetylase RimI-like enzyme
MDTPTMRPLASLRAEELDDLRGMVSDHPMFRFYLDAGLDAVRRGEANRSAWIAASRTGAALGISFDRLEVRTLIGELALDDEIALAQIDGELHAEPASADRIAEALAGRVRSRQGMRFCRLDERPSLPADARCRRLGRADYDDVAPLFLTHYPDSAFSRWMLDGLFLGLFEGGKLVACGGVIAEARGTAHIGAFLTLPDVRRRGLARSVAASLARQLLEEGTRVVTLTTTDENLAACRAYEAAGFRCFDRRVQLNLSAAPM